MISITDCIIEILSWLPVSSLLRFKCVCKLWYNTISDPYFIRKHLHHSRKQPQLVIIPHSTGLCEIGFYNYSPTRLQAHLMFRKESSEVPESFLCSQQVDGLLLLSTLDSLYVCNPSIGEYIKLPEGSSHMPAHPYYRYMPEQRAGFGYDARDKCYRVARYFYRWHDFKNKTYSLGLEVFDLGKDTSWRILGEDPPYPIRALINPVSINGVIYFRVDNGLHKFPPTGVVSFDLKDNKFKVIDRPSCFSSLDVRGDRQLNISELEGELCFVRASKKSKLDIWVYKEDDSWVHAYSIDFDCVNKFGELIGVREGKILLHVYDSHHWLDFCDSKIVLKDLKYYKAPNSYCSFDDETCFHVVLRYVESLASVTTRV
ncbi:uncharacterized protein A4U43_C05F32480 [Asparagus officinalis]|uniref:F-box domain-containing protein n=1 Tax=Asparagus officinalis TaxID=4686 RepID=A0A5P1EYP9_ASPOF|nr:putative F-box protein At4g38870 [Asparagus officinalis]ONK70317.1 uncharacterized protein A4U43_C05F32480 [Asparagus officinalis]